MGCQLEKMPDAVPLFIKYSALALKITVTLAFQASLGSILTGPEAFE